MSFFASLVVTAWLGQSVMLAGAGALTPAEMLKLGEAYAERGDGAKAIVQLKAAVESGKLSEAEASKAERAWGIACLHQRQTKEAIQHFEKSLSTNPKQEKTWLLLGLAYDDMSTDAANPKAIEKNIERAIDVYQRGLQVLPRSAALHHELGMTLLQGDQAEKAIASLQTATTLERDNATYWADVAYAMTVAGQFAPARDAALQAVEIAPDDTDALYSLGSAYMGLKQWKEAEHSFTQALDLDDMHIPTLIRIGMVEVQLNNPQKAQTHWVSVLELDATQQKALELLCGTKDIEYKKPPKDAVKIQKWLEKCPKSPTQSGK